MVDLPERYEWYVYARVRARVWLIAPIPDRYQGRRLGWLRAERVFHWLYVV